MGSNPTPSATALLWCYNLLISCVFFQGAGFVNKGSGIGFSNVACQQVLYILPLGFVPIYFFQRVFK
ncbi:hypothetical protein, partial [Bartonella sp. AP65SXKL]|uniref:hypothetical protein n=1 Tax=Bartonella sp. AP65SXKL TaxID=3243500 RepID=UPI0035D0CCE8